VGDAYFQHKSFERIREFRRLGTTLLIVSHDKAAIQSICDRAILLSAGKLAMVGKPEEVMDYYNALLADHQNQSVKQEALPDGTLQTISGTGEAVVKSIALLNEAGEAIEVADVGQNVKLHVQVLVKQDIDRLVLGYGIKDRLGQVVFGTNTDLKKQPLLDVKAGSVHDFFVSFPANLGFGTYSVQTALVSTDNHLVNNYEWRDLALVFNVVNISKPHFAGCAWIDPTIEIVSK
jgi:lipopolysaccharide transport system ATP-binding protein